MLHIGHGSNPSTVVLECLKNLCRYDVDYVNTTILVAYGDIHVTTPAHGENWASVMLQSVDQLSIGTAYNGIYIQSGTIVLVIII
jgi:hypothetical protein